MTQDQPQLWDYLIVSVPITNPTHPIWRLQRTQSSVKLAPGPRGRPGPWFNIKMSSYQYRKSHCGDKTVVRSSYLHSGISYTGKMSSLYWIGALRCICSLVILWMFLILHHQKTQFFVFFCFFHGSVESTLYKLNGFSLPQLFTIVSMLHVCFLGLCPANESRRYEVTLSPTGWAQT